MPQQDFAVPAEEQKFTPDDTQTKVEYGVEFPDGRQTFEWAGLNSLGVHPDELGTEKVQGEAQDSYQKTLRYSGVPKELGLRLKFIKRHRQVSYSEPVYLFTEA